MDHRNSRQMDRRLVWLLFASVFFGDVYIGVTVPAAIFLLPVVAWMFPPPKMPSVSFWLIIAALCSIPAQFFVGEGCYGKSDIVVHLPLLYSAIVLWSLGSLAIDEDELTDAIMFAGYILGAVMICNMAGAYCGETDFYEFKSLARTPLGLSNCLCALFVFLGNLACYRGRSRSVVGFAGLTGLTLSRAGAVVFIISLAFWLMRHLELRSTRLAGLALIAIAMPYFLVAQLHAWDKNCSPDDSESNYTVTSTESIGIRLAAWRNALNVVEEHPAFGVPRSVLQNRHGYTLAWDPHNLILASLMLYGICGTVFYVWYLYRLAAHCLSLAQGSDTWAGISAGVLSILTLALWGTVLSVPGIAILVAVIAAIAEKQSSICAMRAQRTADCAEATGTCSAPTIA